LGEPLPLGKKLAFGAGSLGWPLASYAAGNLLAYFYMPPDTGGPPCSRPACIREPCSGSSPSWAWSWGLGGCSTPSPTPSSLNPTPFDEYRMWVFYRVYENGTYTYHGAAMEAIGPDTYHYTWPSGLTGAIEFVIRGRRTMDELVNPDSYYNFSFYPPRIPRPEAWPGMPGVDANAYHWLSVGP